MDKNIEEIYLSPYNIEYNREPYTNLLRKTNCDFNIGGVSVGTLELNTGDIFLSAINYFLEKTRLIGWKSDIELMMDENIKLLNDIVNGVKLDKKNQYKLLANSENVRLSQLTQDFQTLDFRLRFIKLILLLLDEDNSDVILGIKQNVDTDMCEQTSISAKEMNHYFCEQADTVNVQLVINYNGEGHKQCYFDDATDVIVYDYNEFMCSNSVLSRCENCGKYFVPISRKDEKYCYYLFNSKHTCKEVGYANRLNNDEISSSYRKAYKTQHAKMQRNKHILDYRERYFEPWVEQAKKKLKKAQKGDITLEKFKQWLNVK